MSSQSLQSTAYGWLMLAGIIVSIWLWSRIAKRDERLLFIYIFALVGAFLGAKLVYIFAEGWRHFGAPDMWLQLATGKTILGALLGGYLAVELAKKFLGYRKATGDWFALIAPVGIIFGRVGCLLHGCCLGSVCEKSWFTIADKNDVARWPAVPLEIIFNLIAIFVFAILRRQKKMTGQHFHLYLIAYGIFRFAHEIFRATPKVFGILSGYQIAALAVTILGAVGFVKRKKNSIETLQSA
ncbi:MAG: prolipoprotein diacylglyceryl transferase [Verrucomicrobiota bacterium]|nr:prolipoprotein diacylglyceryl transferase [Verrucomicrobiota bacterium]